MNIPVLRRRVFIASSAILLLTLVFSLWRNASAKSVEADASAAHNLADLCENIAKIDTAALAQLAALAPMFDDQTVNGTWIQQKNNILSLYRDVSELAAAIRRLRDSMDALSTNEITAKAEALPALTQACLAAVNSASAPTAQLRQDLAALREELKSTKTEFADYRARLVEASRIPYEAAINDLPLQEIYGFDIAAIGSSAEVLDQSACSNFYRRVLTETPNLDWVTLNGQTLAVSPDLLGMDIIVRTFSGDDSTCHTLLVRFSHGEYIKVPAGTTRVIALFCKPERMNKDRYRDENGVRIVGKQLIVVPETPTQSPPPATTEAATTEPASTTTSDH